MKLARTCDGLPVALLSVCVGCLHLGDLSKMEAGVFAPEHNPIVSYEVSSIYMTAMCLSDEFVCSN